MVKKKCVIAKIKKQLGFKRCTIVMIKMYHGNDSDVS